MARTFLVTLHYDGGGFAGWQRQVEERTVQGEVERALQRLCAQPVRVHAAGRTDAGVHAAGMGASCTVPDRWTPAALRRALNALLPEDCRAMEVREARNGFHARKSARGRRYRYVIGTDEAAFSPFRRRYEWALGLPLDAGALAAAARCLEGEHDFHGFSVRSSPRAHSRCRIRSGTWTGRPDGCGPLVRDARPHCRPSTPRGAPALPPLPRGSSSWPRSTRPNASPEPRGPRRLRRAPPGGLVPELAERNHPVRGRPANRGERRALDQPPHRRGGRGQPGGARGGLDHRRLPSPGPPRRC